MRTGPRSLAHPASQRLVYYRVRKNHNPQIATTAVWGLDSSRLCRPDQYAVSRKAIYRDMDYLCKFYHIERTRARGGGYRLVNPRINSRVVLSKEEMDFLGMLGERAELDETERIRLKLIMKKLSDQARMIMAKEESSE